MIDDKLFTENVKNLKSLYKSGGSIYGNVNSYREKIAKEIEEDIKNIGYDLVALGEIFTENKVEKILEIMPNLIKEIE